MINDRFKMILSVYILLRDEEKILLLKRRNTGFEDGNFGLVAGHVDGDEPSTQAICREAKEEAGVTLDPTKLKFVHFMHRKSSDERADVFYETHQWQGIISNREPEKCSELSWFNVNNLPVNTIGYIRQVIENVEKNIYYSESGW